MGNYSFDVKATSIKYGISATKHFTFTIDNALPTKLLDIDESGVLIGFTSDFNKDDYENKGYDTIRVPKTITGVASEAFDYRYDELAYPSYIKQIDFSGYDNLSYLGNSCFRWFASLANVDFSGCTNLSKNYVKGYNFENTSIETLDLSETGYTKFAAIQSEDGMMFNDFLYGMSKLKTLVLPGQLQTISTNLFTLNTLNQII
ncbi:MAG: leucine-rich repeat domain-containing protein [Mycoplasmoidaceae bacterium]|nr:leucine-rich repeat domain-containing protein [Mycoplasmoidaceae bacterium]